MAALSRGNGSRGVKSFCRVCLRTLGFPFLGLKYFPRSPDSGAAASFQNKKVTVILVFSLKQSLSREER